MPKLNYNDYNTRLKTSSLGEVELKYISGGDTHKFMELMGELKEIDGKFKLERKDRLTSKDFTLRVLYNQLLKPKINFAEFQKISEKEMIEIAKAFIKNEESFFENYKETGNFFKDFRVGVEEYLDRHIEPMKEIAREALEKVRSTVENIQKTIPKITLPKVFDVASSESMSFKPISVIQEENNWERHAELLSVSNTSLKVQKNILNEQKSASKLTKWVLVIAGLTLIITLIGVVNSLFGFEWIARMFSTIIEKIYALRNF